MSHVHSTPTGLSSFVGNVALPALLFKSMLTLKFAALNWNFLFAVFKAKSALFALTSILTAVLFYDRERGTYDNCACFTFVSALPLDHQVSPSSELALQSFPCSLRFPMVHDGCVQHFRDSKQRFRDGTPDSPSHLFSVSSGVFGIYLSFSANLAVHS